MLNIPDLKDTNNAKPATIKIVHHTNVVSQLL